MKQLPLRKECKSCAVMSYQRAVRRGKHKTTFDPPSRAKSMRLAGYTTPLVLIHHPYAARQLHQTFSCGSSVTQFAR